MPHDEKRSLSMKIHEYQAKAILAKYGVPVPQGEVVFTAADAQAAADAARRRLVVVKAQIHAGGRGKGGGVKVVKNAGRGRARREDMLGMKLVTHQTGPEGRWSSACSSSRASRSSASSTSAS